MDVATLCSQYQRKMWGSMISRKKLEFSIWDAIGHSGEKVYYMPYSGKHKFEVTTKVCLYCSSPLAVGFRKDEFIAETCKCSADGLNYPTTAKLGTLFPDPARVLQEMNDTKTRNLPSKLSSWISKGYSVDEARDIVSDIQGKRSAKSPAAQKGTKEYSVRCPEYWVKKGLTAEEAAAKVAESQVTNGLGWYVARYGEKDGRAKFHDRVQRWLVSIEAAIEKDPTISSRKMCALGRASKQSLKVFMPLYEKYKDAVRIYLGIDGSQEYFLRDGKDLYFYDFTIPDLRIMVEFHGSAFHPSPLMNCTERSMWRSLFGGLDADTVDAKDGLKKSLALHAGYELVTVWDTDVVQDAIDKIDKLIEQRLNEFQS